MESLDDILRKGDAQRHRLASDEQWLQNQTREMLEKLAASLEASLKAALNSMPEFQDVSVSHDEPQFQSNGICKTTVSARMHTELLDVELGALLGWEPGRLGNVGLGQIAEMHGAIKRRDSTGRPERFQFPFANDVTVNTHCGIDPNRLKLEISNAVARLSKQR